MQANPQFIKSLCLKFILRKSYKKLNPFYRERNFGITDFQSDSKDEYYRVSVTTTNKERLYTIFITL